MRPWPWEQPPAGPALTTEQLLRRLRAKRSRAEGRRGEQLVEHRLRALGIAMVEKINVERFQVKGKALFSKRVSGDFRGILPPNGRSVLVEVKTRPDTLAFNDLAAHQHDKLRFHELAGGLSLIVWVRGVDVAVLPRIGCGAVWKPGQPLTWARAQLLAITKPLARPT